MLLARLFLALPCTCTSLPTVPACLPADLWSDVHPPLLCAPFLHDPCRWNYVFALGYNTLMIPTAAGVFYPLAHMQVWGRPGVLCATHTMHRRGAVCGAQQWPFML